MTGDLSDRTASESPRDGFAWRSAAHGLLRSPWANVAALVAVTFAVASPVPDYPNEGIYLLAPYRMFHPEFLQTDWTFSQSWQENLPFNTLVGLPMLVLPMEAVGWAGRIGCWVFSFYGLILLGRRFEVPAFLSSLAILLWMGLGQSLVGGAWMIGSFEPKTVAYPLLAFSLIRFIDRRHSSAAVLLGLCFSFHQAIGAQAVAGVGLALLVLRCPFRQLIRITLLFSLFALPGLLPVLAYTVEGVANTNADWEFVVRIRMPYHFDPLWFPKRDVLAVFLLLLATLLHAMRAPWSRVLRFSVAFQVGLAVVFMLGLGARLLGYYSFLQLTPFRLLPLLAPLLFFFHLFRALRDAELSRPRWPLAAVFLVAISFLPNPIAGWADRLSSDATQAEQRHDDIASALRWLADNTPEEAQAILPPWRADSFYNARRGQVANWFAGHFHQLARWRERLEALLGPIDVSAGQWLTIDELEARFLGLSPASVVAIAKRYGASYLVSRTEYEFAVSFDTGTYRVYSLTDPTR